MCTVFRWVKAFKAGKFSVEDDPRPGRPKTCYQGLHRYLLTEEQKTQGLKYARELLKTYKGCTCKSRIISNLLTGDETWVHMFEPQRRADNKQ